MTEGVQPDPFASGGADAMLRAALDAGFSETDPHTAAWDFLNSPIDMSLPSFVLPDLPPEPTFMPNDSGGYDFGTYGGTSLVSGVEDQPSLEPPQTSLQFPDTGFGSAPESGTDIALTP